MFFLFLAMQKLAPNAWSQLVEFPNIEVITQKDGLPFNSGHCLAQDNRGFIWIGSSEGLFRFDGYSFVKFLSQQDSTKSLPNNIIVSLAIDQNGVLWAGHYGGFVSAIDPAQFKIIRVIKIGDGESTMQRIFCDSQGTIWTFLKGIGLYRLDEKTKFTFICQLDHLPAGRLGSPFEFADLLSFYEDPNHKFWLSTRNGLYQFDPEKLTLTYESSLNKGDYGTLVFNVIPQGDSGLWCSTWGHGIIYFDLKKKKYKSYLPQTGYGGNSNIVIGIARKRKDEIWVVSASGKGIGVFRTDTGKFTFDQNGDMELGPMFKSMLVDRSGIIWAISDLGLHNWDGREKHFTFFKLKVTHSDNRKYYRVVKTLYDSATGRTIVGTAFADGVHVLERSGREVIINFDHSAKAEPFLIVQDIVRCKDGRILILTRDYLYELTRNNRLVKIDDLDPLFLLASGNPRYTKIIQTEDGDLWLTSYRHGVLRSTQKENKWKRFVVASPNVLVDDYVIDVMEDANRNVWVAYLDSGITVINNSRTGGRHFKHDKYNPTSLVSNSFSDITMTPQGDVFVSTTSGISKFNPQTNSFENETLTTGLPTQIIYSVCSDDHGILWCVTNRGILRIDPLKKKYDEFSAKDGVSGIYEDLHVRSVGNGEMRIFGLQGFYVFRPLEIYKNVLRDAPILITSVKNLTTSVTNFNVSDRFLFSYDDNSISIEFALLNYWNSSKNKYRYRMIGLGQDWLETTEHIVNYSNLAPGTYHFEVELKDSAPKIKQASVDIVIATPYWKQSWFVIVEVLLAASLIYLAYRLRLSQVRREERFKSEYSQQLAEVEMKALKAQMNPHFIFNSLNSIHWYIVKSEPEKASQYLTKFSKLIRIILENSNHKIVSLEMELEAMRLYIELEALRFFGKFEYTIDVDRNLQPMIVGVPPLVVQPFIENAIWHGLLHKDEPGRLDIKIKKCEEGVQFAITDNGIGRTEAAGLKSKSANKDKSYGIKITRDRLLMLNKESKSPVFEIYDLRDEGGAARGTKVIVKVPWTEIEDDS